MEKRTTEAYECAMPDCKRTETDLVITDKNGKEKVIEGYFPDAGSLTPDHIAKLHDYAVMKTSAPDGFRKEFYKGYAAAIRDFMAHIVNTMDAYNECFSLTGDDYSESKFIRALRGEREEEYSGMTCNIRRYLHRSINNSFAASAPGHPNSRAEGAFYAYSEIANTYAPELLLNEEPCIPPLLSEAVSAVCATVPEDDQPNLYLDLSTAIADLYENSELVSMVSHRAKSVDAGVIDYYVARTAVELFDITYVTSIVHNQNYEEAFKTRITIDDIRKAVNTVFSGLRESKYGKLVSSHDAAKAEFDAMGIDDDIMPDDIVAAVRRNIEESILEGYGNALWLHDYDHESRSIRSYNKEQNDRNAVGSINLTRMSGYDCSIIVYRDASQSPEAAYSYDLVVDSRSSTDIYTPTSLSSLVIEALDGSAMFVDENGDIVSLYDSVVEHSDTSFITNLNRQERNADSQEL